MLWLRRLFESKGSEEAERQAKEKTQETIKLRLDQAKDWLKDQTADFFDKINSNTADSYKEIGQLLEQLKASSTALERAALDRDDKGADPRLEKIVLDNRVGLNNKIVTLVKGVKIPCDAEYRTARLFYNSISQQLNQFVGATARNLNVVSMLFPEQVRAVTKNVNLLQNTTVRAKKTLDAESDKTCTVEKARSAIPATHAAILKILDGKEKITRLERTLRDLRERKSVLEVKMGRLRESSEWQALQQLQASSEDAKAGLAQTEHELSQTFSHISKAFRKFAPHAPGEGLDKSERKILDQYAERPLLALDAEVGLKTLNKILESIQRLLLSGKIELKEKLRARAVADIDRLRTTSVLQEFLQRRATLKARVEELDGELEKSEVAKKMADLEAEAVRTGGELAQTRSSLEIAKQSLVGAEKAAQSKLDQLTAALFAVSGKKIEILVPD